MKQQEEAEEVVAATVYDLTINKKGRYELVDADIGTVNDIRFKYVCDDIRINRHRLDYMLEHLCDWSDADSLEARATLTNDGAPLELIEDETVPRR